jgi:hypothetical protein
MRKYRLFAYSVVLALVLCLVLIPAPRVSAATYSVMVLPTPPVSDYTGEIHRDSPAYIAINQDENLDIMVDIDTGVDTSSSSCQVNWIDSNGQNTMTCSGIDIGNFHWAATTFAGKHYTQSMPDIIIENGLNNMTGRYCQIPSSRATAIQQANSPEYLKNNSACIYPMEYRESQTAAGLITDKETAESELPGTYLNNSYPEIIAYPQAEGFAGSISINPAQKTVEQGADFSIIVELNTTVPTSGAAFQMLWTGVDNNGAPAHLNCTGMQAGSFYPGASFGYSDNGTTGQSIVGLFGSTDMPAKRDGLAIIYFTAETPGTYNIYLYDCQASNNQGDIFTLDTFNGIVNVDSLEVYDGTIFIQDSPIEVSEGESFTVEIGLETVVPSKGSSFQLTWEGVTSDNQTAHLTCLEQSQGYIVKGDFYTANSMSLGGSILQDGTGTAEPFAVNIRGDGVTQPAGTGVLATIQFTAQHQGTYTLHLFDLILSDIYAPLTVTSADGQVIVGPPEGPRPPIAPSNLRASKISTNEIQLQWTDNSDGQYGEDSFIIERSLTNNPANFQEIFEVGSDNTTHPDDSNLIPGTTYYYRIRAINQYGPSAWSNICEVKTWPLIPYSPSDLFIETNELDNVEIGWQHNSTDELGYKIERACDEDFENEVKKFYVSSNADDYKDSTIEPGESYYYRVFAYNALGDSLPSESINVYTMPGPPEAPYDLLIDEVTSDYVKLEWDDNSRNEDGFIIERSLSKKFDKSNYKFKVTGSNISKFTDDTIKDGDYYFYRVAAYNRYGESDYALSAYNQLGGSSKVKYVEVNVPARPTELFAELQGYLQIDLSWEDNEDDEEGYHIERALDTEFILEVIDYYVSTDASNYTDTNTEANTTYYYRVYTLNKDSDYIDSESPASNIVAVTTGTPPDPDDIKTAQLDISTSVDDNGITSRGITITNLIGVKSLEITADNQLLTYDDMPLKAIGSSLLQLDTLSLLKQRVIALPDKLFEPGENFPIPPVSITQEYSAQVIGPVVELEPSGSIFAYPITLTLEYDPDSYPADLARQDLVLAYYDAHADKWIELPSTVNTVGHTISAEISHFSTLGIVKKVDRVVEWWRVGAIMAVELVLGLLIYIFIIVRRQSRYY